MAVVHGVAEQSRSGVELLHPSGGRQPDQLLGTGVGVPVRRLGVEPQAGIEAQAGIEPHAGIGGRHTAVASGNNTNTSSKYNINNCRFE